MKLRMLVVAAVGCLVMPAIVHAQATDTTKKDTTMSTNMTMSSGDNPAQALPPLMIQSLAMRIWAHRLLDARSGAQRRREPLGLNRFSSSLFSRS